MFKHLTICTPAKSSQGFCSRCQRLASGTENILGGLSAFPLLCSMTYESYENIVSQIQDLLLPVHKDLCGLSRKVAPVGLP